MALSKEPKETGPKGKYLGLKHLSIRARFLTIQLRMSYLKVSMKSELYSYVPVAPILYGRKVGEVQVPNQMKEMVDK